MDLTKCIADWRDWAEREECLSAVFNGSKHPPSIFMNPTVKLSLKFSDKWYSNYFAFQVSLRGAIYCCCGFCARAFNIFQYFDESNENMIAWLTVVC
jgi:hypothetical protein